MPNCPDCLPAEETGCLVCSHCEGLGWVPQDLDGLRESCRACKGRGVVSCSTCDGTGSITSKQLEELQEEEDIHHGKA